MKTTKWMMKWTTLFLVLNLLCVAKIKAQHVELNVFYLQGIHSTNNWGLYKGGTEFSADYLYPTNNLSYSAGVAFRTVQWGSQLSLSLGAVKTLAHRFELGANLQNGFALFRSRKLYVIGGGVKASYLFLKKEKVQMGASLGMRYTACPAYKSYSKIYTLSEMPVGVFIRF